MSLTTRVGVPDEEEVENRLSMRSSALSGVLGMLLIIAFVGVVPIAMDLHSMPAGRKALPPGPVTVAAWPAWPANLDHPAGVAASDELAEAYAQMADFANRSRYPMQKVEQTIADVKAGRATGNDLYLAARAAAASMQDERDALMGLVLPGGVRDNQPFLQAWRAAQLAALAKLKAMEALEAAASGSRPWDQPAYRDSIQTARRLTLVALHSSRLAVKQ